MILLSTEAAEGDDLTLGKVDCNETSGLTGCSAPTGIEI
jgi:hypothetical protein